MSSEGVQLVYSRVHENTMVYSLGCLWRLFMEWALSVEKRQNGGRLSQKALGVPLPLQRSRFLRAISGRLANRFGSRFWKNPKLLRGVFGPISTPNDYLNTVFNEVVSQLPGSCENNALSRSPREKLQLVAVLSLRVKCLVLSTRKEYMLFKDRPVK